MDYETIDLKIQGAYAVLTLNRPDVLNRRGTAVSEKVLSFNLLLFTQCLAVKCILCPGKAFPCFSYHAF